MASLLAAHAKKPPVFIPDGFLHNVIALILSFAAAGPQKALRQHRAKMVRELHGPP